VAAEKHKSRHNVKLSTMKKLFILFLFGFFAVSSQAQISIGASIGPQFPIGDMADASSIGFGINFSGKYKLNKNMAVGVNLGFNGFSSKSITILGASGDSILPITIKSSYRTIPITGFFEYLFGKGKIRPYVAGDLGLYSVGSKVETMGVEVSASKMRVGFAPSAGVYYALNKKISLMGNLKYNYISGDGGSISYVGLNLGGYYKIK
jgi:opacity protein-like surface antigen